MPTFNLNSKIGYMKKVVLLICVIASLIGTKSIAQDYDGAIGVRLGRPLGITYKNFFSKRSAFEGILTLAGGNNNVARIGLTVLYERHIEIADGLSFLYGFGGHVASGIQLGIDGIIGLDYAFNGIPIDLSLDWKPAFHLIYVEGSRNSSPADFALSVRFYW